MNEFDWTDDINSLPVDTLRASNGKLTYNPILTDEIFDDVKGLVTKLWNTYDNEFGYVDEKMGVVNSLPKEWDSVILMIRMFHYLVQRDVIFKRLSDESNESIKLEMYDRGWTATDF
jgi:hypothetical protein